ncbi:nickel ABC transporter ATP-binding protein NikE [Aureimonas populi]|uniref:Nickel ABC transporter ATP-binding protein NikE n=1 Tax=Aureimonas populi TaxID=1701758 RepID=A0ABW5CNI0_9HYPH|nr:ABC transporter ATP-binding protein [Aureimonas populi]
MTGSLLSVESLSVDFEVEGRFIPALRDVSLGVAQGEVLAIVGESGSGKTTVAMTAVGLNAANARVRGGRIVFEGRDITHASRRVLRPLRGASMAVVFQNARAALNPVRRIGQQIVDAIRAHRPVTRAQARAEALDLLRAVQFRDPERGLATYPHELSGGMCQRAMIAIAIACRPKLLVADEPTTGLDATTQKEVMTLLSGLIRERNMAMVLITHDLGLAALHAQRVAVMQQGRVVEEGTPRRLFLAPAHDYTKRLIRSTPLADTRIETLAESDGGTPLPPVRPLPHEAGRPLVLDVRDLRKVYAGTVAVDGVSLTLKAGESLGLVGESGSGKSTLSRMLTRLIDQTSGTILFEGEDIGGIPERRFYASPLRSRIQLVFQDATDSLNPRWSAFDSIADPLRRLKRLRGGPLRRRVEQLADLVELDRALLERRPHQLSGGQKARVGIARAISVEPRLLVLDEPTAALDVSVQAVVLTLLERLKRQTQLSYVFVSHDLNVVRMMCDRTIVLRNGRVVEEGASAALFAAPQHPYTGQLLDAVPHLSFEAPDEAPARDMPIRSASAG